MHNAIQQVRAGLAIHSDAWCEDAHLAAISLLYEIAIFTQNNEWHVFNEFATRGYICLLSVPGHFDVLHGVDGDPVVPLTAYTHGENRENFNTSHEAWQCLQRDYTFEFVLKFPEQFAGIINSRVVVSKTKAKSATMKTANIKERENRTAEGDDGSVASCNGLVADNAFPWTMATVSSLR